MSNELFDVLKQLALYIKKIIEEGTSNGTIQSEVDEYIKWKVDKFQYTDKGITNSNAHGEYLTKKSWFRASVKLEESVKQSREFTLALEPLTAEFSNKDTASQDLNNFVTKLIHRYFYNLKFKERDLDSSITTFLGELRGEPVKYGAEVELVGITLRPERIEIDVGIMLRQPKIEDIEKEFPAYGFMQTHFLSKPSAILNIEFPGIGTREIQRRVEQAIAILKLFKVGSVKLTRYQIYSDSITDIMFSGTLTSGEKYTALETFLVTDEDVQRLKKFWRVMNDSLPKSFYESGVTKTDHATIAYNRYCDALSQNGILERRIANSIMGLEALFLKPGEMQELVYRLTLRISKLLSLLGYNPHEIKKIVTDAYKVRNLFANGGHLSYKKKKRLESKYKDVNTVLQSVLDYLRISIIVMILINKEKDEFIDLIDDSFIDRKKEEQLNYAISNCNGVIR